MFDKFVTSTYKKLVWMKSKAKRVCNDPPNLSAHQPTSRWARASPKEFQPYKFELYFTTSVALAVSKFVAVTTQRITVRNFHYFETARKILPSFQYRVCILN